MSADAIRRGVLFFSWKLGLRLFMEINLAEGSRMLSVISSYERGFGFRENKNSSQYDENKKALSRR